MRKHAFFIVILVLAAVARFVILFTSQTHVHNDEAIIGLMGKHILEGRYYPFYMYGQPYNACAAWESYLAAVPFVVFGVGVIPLKSGIVVLSLACLVLFYGMVHRLYGRRTAVLAALVFALSPSLLKWHFQVRGYSWYFLSILILTRLFFSIASDSAPKIRKVFLMGLVSGLSLWGLELVLTLVAALWMLLAVRRKWSAKNAVAGLMGFIIGYAPAIVFNLTHHFSNWRCVFADKMATGTGMSLFHRSTFVDILFREMPKFFGPDTVFWYYPETPVWGVVLYTISLVTVAVAAWPFLRAPSRILAALRGDGGEAGENGDFVMLALTAACFVPYLVAPIRVPGYFLGGCFFLSILTGRLLERCFRVASGLARVLGAGLLLLILGAGASAMIDTGKRNQIETLVFERTGKTHALRHITARIGGADFDAVERYLRQHRIRSMWAATPLVFPLLFESGETLAISDPISHWERDMYPETVPMPQPGRDQRRVFVIETDSPLRSSVESLFTQFTGVAPSIVVYGTLTVIEPEPRPAASQ